jgi:hypothetical protein
LSSGFLPATYQEHNFAMTARPSFIWRPSDRSVREQRSKLDLLSELNRHYSADKPDDAEWKLA